MPPKAKDPKGKTLWKVGTPLKDVIPSYCKNLPKDPRPYKTPD